LKSFRRRGLRSAKPLARSKRISTFFAARDFKLFFAPDAWRAILTVFYSDGIPFIPRRTVFFFFISIFP
jgi:hypothetical protein